jgi:leucyl aminopeptidase (aminopeptidase T)
MIASMSAKREAMMARDFGGVPEAKVIEGADILIQVCGRLRSTERIAIVCDTSTRVLGDILVERAALVTSDVHLVEVAPFEMHGQEPPAHAAEQMRLADLCLGITAKSMVHTAARKEAAKRGTRYLSLPDYSAALLAHDALRVNFEERGKIGSRIAEAFTRGSEAQVTTPAGTDVTMRIDGRVGASTPGYVVAPGEMGSPPDIETYVSPLETSARGTVVVDGSIPYPTLGLLRVPVRLDVAGGRVVAVSSSDQELANEVRRVFASAGSEKAYVLAECGVGLNDQAKLSGIMLTDEGAAGTMHFGFGSNFSIGGANEVSFHLDVVMRDPTLRVDRQVVIERGEVRV